MEVAGPGFINLRLAPAAKQEVVRLALRERECFGTTSAHAGHRVMIEFVSANPTGPLHLGHARQAALGDALANLLTAQGWLVSREFYYNDAGVQIANLALSVQARARELLGETVEFPETGYRGDYIVDIARDFLAKKTVTARDGAPVTASGDPSDLEAVRHFAVVYLRNEQDADLASLGVSFDHYFLESSLYTDGKVEGTVKALVDSGMTYEFESALWLKTTEFDDLAGHGGPPKDDKDRVMRKSDGTFTYFVPDVAYHLNKFQRGFEKVINIQGTDHYGTVARVRAGVQAAAKSLKLDVPRGYPDYLLHKMLRVTKGGEEVKMSKRAGTYVTLRDLLEWVGPRRDALLPGRAQGGRRVHFRCRPRAVAVRGQPGLLRAVRACAHLLGAAAGRREGLRGSRHRYSAQRRPRAADQRARTIIAQPAGPVSGPARGSRRRTRAAPAGVLPEGPRRRLSRLLQRRAGAGRRRQRAQRPAGTVACHAPGTAQRAGDARCFGT